ncbi:MAG: SGNH/GDSL hydrolase family protein [Clostridia bacterium]|nr:SGNH/GDSL hydrolase family protein [Clostridia bacterium]
MDISKNNVPASEQVKEENYSEVFQRGGKIKVLFIGNSITRHEPKPEIGWEHDWGMAASAKEKDYVHVAVNFLDEKFGKIDYCVANCGKWELCYYDDEILHRWERTREFQADIVVIRIGENIYNAKDKFEEYPLAPYYANMIKFFAVKPNAQVIVTDLFWANERIDGTIRKVAKENGYTLVQLNDLGDKKENMAIGKFWHNGVAMHPNDEGMQKIAERIVNAIQ